MEENTEEIPNLRGKENSVKEALGVGSGPSERLA